MRRRGMLGAGALALAAGAGAAAVWRWRRPAPALSPQALAAAWAAPVPVPDRGLRLYHLGHSLVGRDMPAMLAQMAAAAGLAGAAYDSQLGWGASLDQHRRGDVPGFAAENAHPRYRPAAEAVASGDYDAVILTEMVDLRDAIRWHDSAAALAHWARMAGQAGAQVWLYETWHRLDDPAGWLERVDGDLAALWIRELVAPAMAQAGVPVIRVIPAGQALAAVVRAAEAGQVPGLTARRALFATTPDGAPDPIHLSDLGLYVVALAHFAALYRRSPEGLPAALSRADGTPATAFEAGAAALVQRLVWDSLRRYPEAGFAGAA